MHKLAHSLLKPLKGFRKVNPAWFLISLLTVVFLFTNAYRVEAATAYDNWAGATSLRPNALYGTLTALKVQIDCTDADGNFICQNEGATASAMGNVTGIIASMYESRPSSAIIWAQDQVNMIAGYDSILVQAQDTTYSPGIGFELMRPILGFWTWARNIAYSFFIIILIIVAFLILFRQQLGGQTMVTIANSLPSILVSLALVTFSYPLSAIFIDIITVGTNFTFSVMVGAEGSPGFEYFDQNQKSELQPDDPKTSIWGVWEATQWNTCVGSNADSCGVNRLIPDLPETNMSWIAESIRLLVPAGGEGNPTNILVSLLIAITALGAAFKLMLALLNNYIILTTFPIFSPFVFLTAAIPSGGGPISPVISNYFKMLLASALVFIAIYAILLFLIVLSVSFDQEFSGAGNAVWQPPLLGYSDAAVGGGLFKTITVFGIFLYLPSIPDLIKDNLGVAKGNVFFETMFRRTNESAKFTAGAVTGLGRKLNVFGNPG
ncbi:MAG: hypothetical protein QY330_01560 [Candidatus Dojkabacteria bacterium]|uniref:Uncharacterized protein n=1 Tax=Candidatus Dojkabacteria bacterium TaxID=2099670 RepID=A0A952DUK8_9BACT|nr:hypothetical protein [Candidatus Dojkabacteria bacterium]WKZ28276.1 MAG: hypothetical protein QY330_01560 [Candidatus Dojkabacteria bacterium]